MKNLAAFALFLAVVILDPHLAQAQLCTTPKSHVLGDWVHAAGQGHECTLRQRRPGEVQRPALLPRGGATRTADACIMRRLGWSNSGRICPADERVRGRFQDGHLL